MLRRKPLVRTCAAQPTDKIPSSCLGLTQPAWRVTPHSSCPMHCRRALTMLSRVCFQQAAISSSCCCVMEIFLATCSQCRPSGRGAVAPSAESRCEEMSVNWMPGFNTYATPMSLKNSATCKAVRDAAGAQVTIRHTVQCSGKPGQRQQQTVVALQ